MQCSDKKYYVGSSTNIEGRLQKHNAGTYSGFTKKRLPVTLIFSQEFPTIEEAFLAERMIKGWTRSKKEALINSDFELLHELAKCTNESSHENL